MKLNMSSGVAGHFTLKAISTKTGKERILVDFPNLILDAGLERMGTGDMLEVCRIGTGNSTPIVSQTQLDNKIASTSTIPTETVGAQATAPYFGWNRKTFRFAEGVAAGNLSEVGVGWGNTTTDNFLFSRALILDGSGNPTTINVLSDEILDIVYELRVYPPLTDLVVTDINLGPSTHTATIRAARVTSSNDCGIYIGRAARVFNNFAYPYVYNGTIGAITATPSGTSSFLAAPTTIAYVANSKKAKGTVTVSLSQGNFAGGITALLFGTTLGTYQVGFSPAIAKNSNQVLKFDVEISWSRYVA